VASRRGFVVINKGADIPKLLDKTVFDVGMYDAADTVYYLEEGYRVVAVEANPALVERARQRLREFVDTGRLHLVNAAIGTGDGLVELFISGDDLGSSSTSKEHVLDRTPVGSYFVPTVDIQGLFDRYGLPYYLKVDIEGADDLCVLSLQRDARPQYLSFEIGEDIERLVTHAVAIGYTKFRIVNQWNFLELASQARLYDRLVKHLSRLLGYSDPRQVRRAGRFFAVGHSSGPAPWCTRGGWYSAQAVLSRWRTASDNGQLSGWYDMHAA
jgi:FkbM family methyltransferase